jgi:hypothetical protein
MFAGVAMVEAYTGGLTASEWVTHVFPAEQIAHAYRHVFVLKE